MKGFYPFALRTGVVPASDGAGVVEAVGSGVTRFKKGDKVLTLFNQGHLAGSLDYQTVTTGVGGTIDGALQQYGAYSEQGLVAMPSNLDFLQGSTLTCAGLTAWNGLYGLEGRSLKPGDWVLTQGTGGVSMFAVQFAKAAGAKVIATTSSAEKGKSSRIWAPTTSSTTRKSPTGARKPRSSHPAAVVCNTFSKLAVPTP